MASLVRWCGRLRVVPLVRAMSSLDSTLPQYGSGVGKGGGAGGSVRESGGAFGVREAVMEEEYFRRLTAQQLEALHDHYIDEIQNLQKQLKELEETMNMQRQKLRKLKEVTEHKD